MYFSLTDVLRAEHEAIVSMLAETPANDVIGKLKGIVEFTNKLIDAEKAKEGS